MTAVDLYNGNANMPLSLATRSTVTTGGVSAPDGGMTLTLLAFCLGALAMLQRRKD